MIFGILGKFGIGIGDQKKLTEKKYSRIKCLIEKNFGRTFFGREKCLIEKNFGRNFFGRFFLVEFLLVEKKSDQHFFDQKMFRSKKILDQHFLDHLFRLGTATVITEIGIVFGGRLKR